MQLIKDVPNIVEKAKTPLSGPTDKPHETTPVVINSESEIYLSGVGHDAHEPFRLCKPGQWTFCKTAQKPYNDVVSAILLRAWMLAPKNLDLGYVTCMSDLPTGFVLV